MISWIFQIFLDDTEPTRIETCIWTLCSQTVSAEFQLTVRDRPFLAKYGEDVASFLLLRTRKRNIGGLQTSHRALFSSSLIEFFSMHHKKPVFSAFHQLRNTWPKFHAFLSWISLLTQKALWMANNLFKDRC